MAVSRIDEAGLNVTQYGNRNLVINGAMTVAQRGTSKTGLVGQEYAVVDRFKTAISSLGTWTASQSTDAPTGFANSLKYECTTADASPAAADFMRIETRLEAQDLQRLAYGTSSAKELTLSFWVKSNKTGDYVTWIYQTDDTRSFSTTYTINSSATWEYKTVTIPADTVGVIDNNNDIGLMLFWCLGAGTDYTSGSSSSSWGADVAANRYVGQTVNLADSTSNYWQITGVQLEVGDTATGFEHRSYGDELQRCQRYFQTSFSTGVTPNGSESACVYQTAPDYSGGTTIAQASLVCKMRTLPTVVTYTTSPSTSSTTNRVSYYNGSSWGNSSQSLTNRTEGTFAIEANTGDTNTILIQFNYTADAEL